MNLINQLSQPKVFLEFYTSYCLFCIPIIYMLISFSHVSLKKQINYLFLWLYSLAVTIPFLGILMVLAILMTMYFKRKTKQVSLQFKTVEYPDYQSSPASSLAVYGEGFGFKVAQSNCAPQQVRQNLLLLINKNKSAQVNKINTLVLSDEIDEMRLYAQVLIEQQEKEIAHRATYILRAMSYEKDIFEMAKLKKQMAEVLWEQVYRDLVNKISFASALQRIKQYAMEANNILVHDCELPILLAKVAIKEFDLNTAQRQLEIARERRAPNYKVVSYLAEIAYKKKEYSKVKTLFKHTYVLFMQPIAAFWVKHD